MKYRLYAGYYELWITTRVLRRPLLELSSHRSLAAAVRKAESIDPDAAICFDESLREEAEVHYIDEFGLSPEDIRVATFDGAEYDIARGLSELTLDNLRQGFDCKASPHDLRDIMNYLHAKTRQAARRLSALCAGRTYRDLFPIVEPHLGAA